MIEVNMSNVVSIKKNDLSDLEPLQTPSQALMMRLHELLDKFYTDLLSPFKKLLELVDGGTNDMRSFLKSEETKKV